MHLLYKLFDLMARIPQDKALHFIWGQVLALSCFLAFGRDMHALYLSVVVSLCIFWLKEVMDRYTPGHTYDGFDILAGALGALPVWLLGYFIAAARHA